MVAFELGVVHEKGGQAELAIGWFTIAAERFRRPEWRNRAAEGLRRLGAPVPEPIITSGPIGPLHGADDGPAPPSDDLLANAEPIENLTSRPEPQASLPLTGASPQPPRPDGKSNRRGRRGGRGRGKGGKVAPAVPQPKTPATVVAEDRRGEQRVIVAPAAVEVETAAPPPSQTRARAIGDPAFASRLAQLEAQLRRLIGAPLYNMDELDQAPAGPGVLLVAESDQSTYYYVESCRTLRIALGQVAASGRGRSSESSIRGRMSEFLGIPEAKVSKYLKDHCSARWLQLDEGASHLAHFTIAVLKPALND